MPEDLLWYCRIGCNHPYAGRFQADLLGVGEGCGSGKGSALCIGVGGIGFKILNHTYFERIGNLWIGEKLMHMPCNEGWRQETFR